MNIIKYAQPGYERIARCIDEESGLDAVIAIHNTKLGPAMGGTRYAEYESFNSQVEDALRLSMGMTYKNSLCGNNFGGGKAVINKKSIKDKDAAFKVYADFVNTFNGQYITAGDVGTYQSDLIYLSKFTNYVGGMNLDSSLPTAKTVFYGIKAALDHLKIDNFTLSVAGLGKVGSKLIDLCFESKRLQSTVFVSEPVDEAYSIWAKKNIHHYRLDPGPDTQAGTTVFSPCALGKVINKDNIDYIKSQIVCGAANNQLESDDILKTTDFLYIPDYLANSGGVIAVANEYLGKPREQIEEKLLNVYDKTLLVIEESARSRFTTVEVANAMAEDRLK